MSQYFFLQAEDMYPKIVTVPTQYYINKIIEEGLVLVKNEQSITISPMSDGYCVITDVECYDDDELLTLMSASLINDRTIVCMQVTESILTTISKLSSFIKTRFRIIKSINENAAFLSNLIDEKPDENAALFIMSENAIEKQFSVKIKSDQDSFSTPEMAGKEQQNVQFVGVGTNLDMLTEQARSWIVNSSDIILFERTYENIVRHIERKGNVYILPYTYGDFDRNIRLVDGQLAVLSRLGIKNVTVLIEGNPQIYDVPNKLSNKHRNFYYEIYLPIGIAISHYLEEKYCTNFMNPSHVYFTGFNERHGRTRESLITEIVDYTNTDVTCVIVEMYAGSIELVLSAIRESGLQKSIFVVSNAFTSKQSIYLLSSSCEEDLSTLDVIKGELTTLIIIDDRRFYSKSPSYRKAQKKYGFENYLKTERAKN